MTQPSNKLKAPIYEIFFSYQGEGLYTGLAQIFVRFAGCNIRCNYCDTAYSTKVSDKAKFQTSEELLNNIVKLYKKNKKNFSNFKPSIAITGGEPLIHIDFLKEFLPKLKKSNFEVYLETNGTLPQNLKKVIKFCDIVSMDFKMPSQCGKVFWKQHGEFLKISKGKVFVKTVLTKTTKLAEITKTAQIIKKTAKNTHLILQPSIDKDRPQLQELYKFYTTAVKILANVHLMVQMHKIYRVR